MTSPLTPQQRLRVIRIIHASLMEGADQWWVASQGRLIAMWATMEGAALFNAVVWFMTRDPTPLEGAAVALVMLFLLRPGRYLGSFD